MYCQHEPVHNNRSTIKTVDIHCLELSKLMILIAPYDGFKSYFLFFLCVCFTY